MAHREKRFRGSLFTQKEKDVLKEVVVQRATLIENKRTDAFSLKQKKDAWTWVASTFNSYPNVTTRTSGQLKKAWNNLKTRRKKLQAEDQQCKLATGSGEPFPELLQDRLMVLAVPQEYDSDAIAMRGSSSCEHPAQSASPSFRLLTGTPPVLEEDLFSSDDEVSCTPPQSCLSEEMTDLPTQVEEEPTTQSRHFINLGGHIQSFPHTSCARDEIVSGSSSAGMVRLLDSSGRMPTDSAWLGTDRPRSQPSATVVRSSSVDSARETPTDFTWLGRDQPRSNPSATAVRPPSNDSARGSPTVSAVVMPTTSAVAVSSSAIAGRRIFSVGQDRGRSLPRPVPSGRRTTGTADRTTVPAADTPEDTLIPSATKTRLVVVREELAERMVQLRTIDDQTLELHEVRMREARADAEAAEARLRAENARATNLEEELEYERWCRRRLGFIPKGFPQP